MSGKVSANGPINLVFPAVAAEPGEPLHLQIESIGYYDESANLRTVEGTWALELAAPSMEDVEQESNLQRRGPVSIDVNGAAVRIEAVLSERETVVKYSLPSGLTATGGLSVAADGRELAFHRSDVTLSGARLWFEPVPLSATLTVVFDGLLVLKPEPSDARLELQLGSLTDAPSDDYDGAHGYLLSWEQIGEGPEVDRVLVLEQPSGPAALIIDVDGSFSPHLGRRPVLIADGTAIDVVGMTNFNANSNRGPITRVEARVPLDAVPQSVIIHYSGAADAFADVTGVLAAP